MRRPQACIAVFLHFGVVQVLGGHQLVDDPIVGNTLGGEGGYAGVHATPGGHEFRIARKGGSRCEHFLGTIRRTGSGDRNVVAEEQGRLPSTARIV